MRLKTLYRELEQHGGAASEGQKSVKLLSILPSEYSELVKNIKTLDQYRTAPVDGQLSPDLDFKKVYDAIYRRAILEEEEQSITNLKIHSATVMYASTSPRNFSNGPRRYQPFQGTCFNCSERGHIARNCPNIINKSKTTAERRQKGQSRFESRENSGEGDFGRTARQTAPGETSPREFANVCMMTSHNDLTLDDWPWSKDQSDGAESNWVECDSPVRETLNYLGMNSATVRLLEIGAWLGATVDLEICGLMQSHFSHWNLVGEGHTG